MVVSSTLQSMKQGRSGQVTTITPVSASTKFYRNCQRIMTLVATDIAQDWIGFDHAADIDFAEDRR